MQFIFSSQRNFQFDISLCNGKNLDCCFSILFLQEQKSSNLLHKRLNRRIIDFFIKNWNHTVRRRFRSRFWVKPVVLVNLPVDYGPFLVLVLVRLWTETGPCPGLMTSVSREYIKEPNNGSYDSFQGNHISMSTSNSPYLEVKLKSSSSS